MTSAGFPEPSATVYARRTGGAECFAIEEALTDASVSVVFNGRIGGVGEPTIRLKPVESMYSGSVQFLGLAAACSTRVAAGGEECAVG
jgi:hypothetical protein